MLRSLFAVTLLLGLAGALSACSTARVYPTSEGFYANEAGRQLFLYRYSSPQAGRFPCGPECSAAWTPLYAGSYDYHVAETEFTIMLRDDGNSQWAYRGRPIYFYAGRMSALLQDAQLRAGLWVPFSHSALPEPMMQ